MEKEIPFACTAKPHSLGVFATAACRGRPRLAPATVGPAGCALRVCSRCTPPPAAAPAPAAKSEEVPQMPADAQVKDESVPAMPAGSYVKKEEQSGSQ